MSRPQFFKKINRVRKRSEFQSLFKSGRKFVSDYYFLYAKSLPGTAPATTSRVGISVPSKLGGAVFRNRQKRIVREKFRRTMGNFPVPLEAVVVMSRKPPDRVSQDRDLDRMFQWLAGFKPSSAK